MKQNAAFMMPKIINYLKYESEKTSFIHRFAVDFLVGKGYKSKNTVVESYILVKLIQSNKIYADLVISSLSKGLNFDN